MKTIDVTYDSAATPPFTFASDDFTGEGEYLKSDGTMQVDIPASGSVVLRYNAKDDAFTFVGVRVVPDGADISAGNLTSSGIATYIDDGGVAGLITENSPFSVARAQQNHQLQLTDAGHHNVTWKYCIRINDGTGDIDDDPKIYNRDE